MNKSSGDKRMFIAVLLTLAFGVLFYFVANNKPDANEGSHRYELTAKDKNGNWMGLLCFDGVDGGEFEFSLNHIAAAFQEIQLRGKEPINSKKPVMCYAYPYEKFDISERLNSTPPEQPGRKRLVVIGDSWAFGEGAPIGNAFPELMNRVLAASGRQREWNVLNMARPGCQLKEIMEQEFIAALLLEPDSILFAWSLRSMPSAWNDVDKTNNPDEYGGPRFTVPQTIDTTELINIVTNMRSESEKAGVDFSIALLPVFVSNDESEKRLPGIYANVSDELNKHGFDHIDLTASIKGPVHGAAGEILPDVDSHLNAAIYLINALKLSGESISINEYFQKPRFNEPVKTTARSYVYGQYSSRLFLFVNFLFVLALISILLVMPDLLALVSREAKMIVCAALALATGGFLIRHYMSPHAHMIFFDEFDRYRIISLWLQGDFKASLTDNIPGSMLPFFYFYKLFGANPAGGFMMMTAISALTILLFYAVTRLAFQNSAPALLASLFLAVSPLYVRFSASHSIDVVNLFFVLLSVLAMQLNLRNTNTRTLLFFYAACAFVLFTRIENALFLFALFAIRGMMLSSQMKYSGKAIKATGGLTIRKVYSLVFAFVFFIYLSYLYVCISSSPQSAHLFNMFANISNNIKGNILFFFENQLMPLPYAAIAVAGGVGLFKSKMSGEKYSYALFFILWFAVDFLAHLASAAGGYDSVYSRDTSRYAIQLLPAISFFAAAGVIYLIDIVRLDIIRITLVAATVTFLLLTPFLYNEAISQKNDFMHINSYIVSTASRFAENTYFITNSEMAYDSLELDAERKVKYVQEREIALNLCDNENCVYVLLTRGESTEIYQHGMNCIYRFAFGPGNLYFCEKKEAAEMPDFVWKDPDSKIAFGDFSKVISD